MKLFIGIDVSSKDLQVAITDSENYQKPLLNQSFSNDLIGANEVKKIILQLAKQNSYDKVIIGMEATSIYSFHPAYFFANDEDLQKLILKLMSLILKTLNDFMTFTKKIRMILLMPITSLNTYALVNTMSLLLGKRNT